MSMVVNPFVFAGSSPPVALPVFSGAVSASTTITIPAHSAGDFIFIFAYQDGTATPPTIPPGWNALAAPTGAVFNAGALAYKKAASGSEVSGTWTGAAGLVAVVVDSSIDMGVGSVSVVETGTGTSIPAPAITQLSDAYSGDSVVLSFAGHRSTDPNMTVPPPGMTNIVGGSGSACVLGANHSTTGVSSWSAVNASVGGSSSGYASVSVELVFPTGSTATIDELTGSGNWIVPPGVTVLSHVLLVAGGGGGGLVAGGGGGGGELRHIFNLPVTPGASIAYAIGAGGAGATVADTPGNPGGDTTFDVFSVEGGGRGGCRATSADATKAPTTGGSGGGGGGGNTSTVNLGAPAGVGRSNKGGNGSYSSTGQNRGGGGGGAGGVGGLAATSIGGNGGDGLNVGAEFSYLASYGDGTGKFAGGGGGGVNGTIITLGAAGSGGGGAGSGNTNAGDGVDSTGGGGGGGGATGGTGGDGGDGTIIIVY